MLGIIIGVGSVVLLTSIGNGLQAFVSEQFEALGSNTVYVVPGTPFGEGGGFGGNQEQTFLETTKTTLKPRNAASKAMPRPVAPPPMMATSYFFVSAS